MWSYVMCFRIINSPLLFHSPKLLFSCLFSDLYEIQMRANFFCLMGVHTETSHYPIATALVVWCGGLNKIKCGWALSLLSLIRERQALTWNSHILERKYFLSLREMYACTHNFVTDNKEKEQRRLSCRQLSFCDNSCNNATRMGDRDRGKKLHIL